MAPKQLQLSTRIQSSFGNPDDPDYVFDIAANGDQSFMAVSLSTNAIKLYDPATGSFKGDLIGHQSTVTGVNFPDTSSPQLLFSSSTDGSIRTWDCRGGKQVMVFKAPESSQELWSFDVGGSATTLVAAGGDAKVLIWDWRSKKLEHTLDAYHTEAVTQTHFHPVRKELLVTASVDGQINVLSTIGSIDPEDALDSAMSAGTSLSKIGFYGKESELIWALTHIETLCIFNMETLHPVATFGDTRSAASYSWSLPSVNYLINCHSPPGTDHLWLAAGTNDGSVGYFPVEFDPPSDGSKPSAGVIGDVGAILQGGHDGHDGVVRAIWVNDNQTTPRSVFCWTGGEDGRLCCWSQNGSTERGRAWVSSRLVMRKPSRQRQSPY